ASEPGEESGVAGGTEAVPGGGVATGRQAAVVQDAVDVLGRLVRAGHQRHPVARDVGDGAGEQWVVGAAQDERVASGVLDGLQVAADDLDELAAHRLAAFDVLHQAWGGHAGELYVGRGGEGVVVRHRLDGGPGGDHAHPAVAGGAHRPPGGGLDHLDDGDVVTLACVAQHGGAGAVAGDHEHLDVVLDEVVHHLERVGAHLRDGFGTVRLTGGVSHVDDRLVRQLVDDRPGDRQAADPAVEDPNTRVRHASEGRRPAYLKLRKNAHNARVTRAPRVPVAVTGPRDGPRSPTPRLPRRTIRRR